MHQPATPSHKESAATAGEVDIERHKVVRKIVALVVVAMLVSGELLEL